MATSPPSSQQASNTFEFISRSVEDTQALGERLGAQLAAGDVLGLVGELGSGKTTFIQGLAKGLGVDPNLVRSPTFVLLREYPGRVPLTHIDGYRLESGSSVIWLDMEWVFDPKKVTALEWADRVADSLPADYLELRFAHKSANQRSIAILGHGARSQQLVEGLR